MFAGGDTVTQADRWGLKEAVVLITLTRCKLINLISITRKERTRLKQETYKCVVNTVATDALVLKQQAVIPLKSIPMSRHLPEMPAECQTLQIWLPLTTLTLCWHCSGFHCLFSWPWWRHWERSDRRDTKSENKIPSTWLTPLLRRGLLRTLSTLAFWSTMDLLPFHVRRAMPRFVNPCMSSVEVCP